MNPSWDDMHYALAVARNGSTLRAARDLAVSQTTVARRIDQLEIALACRLFDRRQAGYRLTEVGRKAMRTLEAIEREVEALVAQFPARQRQSLGGLRIGADAVIAQRVLMPVLEVLRPQFPLVSWELVITDAHLDVAGGEADVAVRAEEPPNEASLIVRRLPLMDGSSRQWLVYQQRRRADPALRALIDAVVARIERLRSAARTR
jgi:DNA-binding transcriptional LysR family regulator